MRQYSLVTLIGLMACLPRAGAQSITVSGGEKDLADVVVKIPAPKGIAATTNAVELSSGGVVPAQIAGRGQTDDPGVEKFLVFVLPALKAGQKVQATPVTLNHVVAPPAFRFGESKEGLPELNLVEVNKKRLVLQYFNHKRDATDHYYTFKPFHNVFDPVDGSTMLTNTSAKTAKDGQFPHHRGLFFGFNRISYTGPDGKKKTADIWHGTQNVFSEHEKMLFTEAGQVLGRQRAQIAWHGSDGATFAEETRELTVYNTPGGTLIDWSTRLVSKAGTIRLDGDPQHAGFHFRANQEVAKNGKEQTYYLRPDGKGKNGETRNWDAKGKNPQAINLPWNAMSFLTDGKRFTVLRVNHPSNPGETRGSEREYGRFGDYFEYDLTPEKPLQIRYRLWIQQGEMSADQCERIARAFVNPPKAVAGDQ